MGPKVKTVQQSNIATPVAEDIVRMIQGNLDQGAFDLGSGPQQRRAGTALDSFVANLESRLNAGPSGMSALEQRAESRTNRQAGDLRESMGDGGNRYSSALGNSEALLRATALEDLNVADIEQQKMDMSMLLEGINQIFTHSNRRREMDLGALVSFMQAGTINPETIVSPGLGQQLISGIISGGSAYLAGKGGA